MAVSEDDRAARRRARLGDRDRRDGARRGHAHPARRRDAEGRSGRHLDRRDPPRRRLSSTRVAVRHLPTSHGGLVLPESAQGVTSRRRKTATGVPPPVVLVVRRPRRQFDVETTEFSGAPQGDDSRPDATAPGADMGFFAPAPRPSDRRRHRARAGASLRWPSHDRSPTTLDPAEDRARASTRPRSTPDRSWLRRRRSRARRRAADVADDRRRGGGHRRRRHRARAAAELRLPGLPRRRDEPRRRRCRPRRRAVTAARR